jgi:lipopolysaccharide export system protein LptC
LNILSTFFALIFLVIIAITSFWLKEEVNKEYLNKQKDLNSGPDYFLKTFKATQTNEKGEIKFTLDAKNMEHFQYADKTYLKKPHYTKYEGGNPHSFIISKKGEINNKGDEIYLKDNVVLTRLPTKKKKILKLFSDELNIFTKKDVITSKKAVKIIQEPDIEIDGVGMKYDKNEGTIKLLSNVKVYYEKPKKK